MSRSNAILLVLFAALVGPPAFSADPPPRTTTPRSEPAPKVEAAPKPVDDIDPATGFARSTVVRPLRDSSAPNTPAPPGSPAQFGPPPAATPALPPPSAPLMPGMPGTPSSASPKPHIALILPIGSPQLGRLADAVRQGFAAAAEAEGKNALPIVLTNVGDDGAAAIEACARSQAAGAILVITGLTRDGASAVAKSECTSRTPVLTLNQPTEDTGVHPQLYSISLSLEQEARQAALLAVSEGWHSAILIASKSALAQRVQAAFEQEWVRAAGEVAGRVTFSGGPEDAPLVKERLAQMSRGDMVFLALDSPDSRLVRPYVSGMLPVYATSLSVDPRAEATVNVDLQGVRYVDMPWFVQPDHPAVMVYPQPRTPMPVDFERLYALGIDAYRIATVLVQGDRSKLTLDGVTGKITLEGNQFARALIPAEVDGGRVVPLRNR
ncbi:Penicillin-binding protein activator LpoA [Usitatibacter rugosus]|uniref:Penicillin-binding protein activator LpoA n=1 Tax=Usitatibacter rugosus TaxID=2732067 RepID=A0A6M4GSZ9_9PROT|nr:penicillin-binding protein activator [Usitatibacter rugosus]QJR09604.1 Penicillin-binding protein activator LpoA [Usitatibacter rugosus]